MPTADSPDQGQAPSLGRELRGWAIALAFAVPVLGVAWFVLREVPEPWNLVIASLATVIPLIAIGLASKSNLWVFLVWLGPIAILQLLLLAGFRNALVFWPGMILAWVWTAGIMLSGRFGEAALRLVGGAHLWLTALGLPTAKRAAFRDFRRAWQLSAEERQDQLQLEDLPRTVRAFRDEARRLDNLVPPDERWAAVYDAVVSAITAYADMLEGRRALDYDEARAMSDRGRQLLHELLREESPTYRFLTHIPFD